LLLLLFIIYTSVSIVTGILVIWRKTNCCS
jgi:hypothetical protein